VVPTGIAYLCAASFSFLPIHKKVSSLISLAMIRLSPTQSRSDRLLVENAINEHLPQDQLRILKVTEESERDHLEMWGAHHEGRGRRG
jgi:hypothetical protein